MLLKKTTFNVDVIFDDETEIIPDLLLTNRKEHFISKAIKNGFRKEEINAFVVKVDWEQTEGVLPMSNEELEEFCKEDV